jgi:hypothetical protein
VGARVPRRRSRAWGARIVGEDRELRAALEALAPGLPATLGGFWSKQYKPAFARKLVSSQLDVDRLDYLLRDGHYSGAGYATYDLDWILHALAVEDVRSGADDPARPGVDYRRGMYAVEQYLFARSYMYAQVYHHKTVRAAEWMLIKVFERYAQLARAGVEPPGLPAAASWPAARPLPVADYLRLHDVSVTAALDAWAGRGFGPPAADLVLGDLAARLVDRRLFKTFDLGDDKAASVERCARAGAGGRRPRFGAPAAATSRSTPPARSATSAADDEELHVVDHPRYGAVTLGRLLEDMPLGQPMSTIRLVCAPELVDAMRPVVEARAGPSARPPVATRSRPSACGWSGRRRVADR